MPSDDASGDNSVTRLIQSAERGDQRAADLLLEAVYDELRSLAAARIAREKPGQTITATVLVHEAYLRLLGNDDRAWNGRAHFFGAAAEAMRRILIEQARRKATERHGGGREREPLVDAIVTMPDDGTDLIALSEALDRLEAEDSTKAAIVKLRYFAGMTLVQAADALGISRATADRYWTYSRARLYLWVDGAAPPGPPGPVQAIE